jgi:hypothetical protein
VRENCLLSEEFGSRLNVFEKGLSFRPGNREFSTLLDEGFVEQELDFSISFGSEFSTLLDEGFVEQELDFSISFGSEFSALPDEEFDEPEFDFSISVGSLNREFSTAHEDDEQELDFSNSFCFATGLKKLLIFDWIGLKNHSVGIELKNHSVWLN